MHQLAACFCPVLGDPDIMLPDASLKFVQASELETKAAGAWRNFAPQIDMLTVTVPRMAFMPG